MFNALMKNIDLSSEAISFQGASKLALEMTELFQSVIDYRNSIRGKSSNIQSDVYKFHIKNVTKQLSDLIYKHTGLVVNSFNTSMEVDYGYAVLMSFGTDLDKGNALAGNAIAKYSGQPVEYHYGYVPENEEDINKALENLAETIDTVKAKMMTNKFAGIEKVEHIFCNIYFCYISAYLHKDVVHTEAPELEAQEIAAIMLHEIGHMLSTIEHAADLVRTHQSVTEEISFNNVEEPDVAGSVRAAMKGVSKLKLDKETYNRLNMLEQGGENIEEVQKKSGIVGKALAIVVELIGSLTLLLASTVRAICFRGLMLVFGGGEELSAVLSMYKNKRSDFMSNFGDNSICERYADEFISRHGFAQYQISALGKLHKMAGAEHVRTTFQAARESKTVYRIAQARLYILMNMFGFDDDTDGTYENEGNRAKSFCRDVLKVFKEVNMPSDMLDFYIKNYENTEKAYEAYKPKSLAKKILAANAILTRVVNLKGLIRLVIAGRADSNYKKLMDAVREINANKLHYYRAKLDQLYRKAK